VVSEKTPLSDLAKVFVRLGTLAFGGPAGHIAMMEEEVVRRRHWLTREEFLDYLGAANLIPGPNSTELAIHIGYGRGGWPGLLIAGLSFVVPATAIVMAVAWGYTRYGALPAVAGVLYGVKPVVIAIVAQALWNLGRSAMKTRGLMALAVVAVAASALGVNELLVLAGAALACVGVRVVSGARRRTMKLAGVIGASALAGSAALSAAAVSAAALSRSPFSLSTLFLTFTKIGSILFGSGYVLLAFLRADFVEHLGWLTERQLLDAIAVGQITPGPVFTTATFIGYVLGGPAGALVATAGIFLPAFVFVALSGPLVPRLRRSPVAAAALDGVNVASLALMAVVSWQLGWVALRDPLTVAIALLSVMGLVFYRINSAWLIAAGALVGWMVTT
jgi:chromate transporter